MKRFVIFLGVALFFSTSYARDTSPPPVVKPDPNPVAYAPNVTKSDLRQSGARCAGNLCTDRGGRQWDCTGGGRCSRIDK